MSTLEEMDRLTAISKKLTNCEFSVSRNFSVALNSPFLKVWKPECAHSSYSPQVFLVLRNVKMNIQTLFLTYNEESLEEATFTAESDAELDLIVHYVTDRIQRSKLAICPGVNESSILNLNVDPRMVLIEKYGSEIIYRSRNCVRAVESLPPGQLCVECQTWLQKNLEMQMTGGNSTTAEYSKEEGLQSLELHVLPDLEDDFEVYAEFEDISEEADTKEELREEDKPKAISDGRSNSNKSPVTNSKKCTSCKHRFKTSQELYRHLQVCAVKCDQCNYTAVTNNELKRHIVIKHGEGGGTHQCPVDKCGKMFKIHLGKSMRNHIENVHRIDPDNPPENLKEKFLPVIDDVPRDAASGRRMYPCTVVGCSYVGKDITALRYHQPVHTGESLYCCTTCGKSFRYKKELYLCEKRHKGELNYFCKQCDKRFISKKKLDIHIRTHTGEKPFGCPICPFRCARKDNLNTHSKKHHGVTLKEAELQQIMEATTNNGLITVNPTFA